MKGLIRAFGLAILCIAAPQADADFFPPQTATHSFSNEGRTIALVEEVRRNVDGKNVVEQHVSIHKYDAQADQFHRTASFFVSEARPGSRLFISEEGDHVVFASVAAAPDAVALRVYKSNGALAGKWKLNELLSKEQLAACAKTTSTTQWIEDAGFIDGAFVIEGPCHGVIPWGSSYTVRKTYDPNVAYSVQVALKQMSVSTEDLNAPRNLEPGKIE